MNFYNKKLVRVFCLFKHKAWAITLGQNTFYSVPKEEVSIYWKRHEDKHKQQWKEVGLFLFPIKYLWFSMTRGYYNNPYEREARRAELTE